MREILWRQTHIKRKASLALTQEDATVCSPSNCGRSQTSDRGKRFKMSTQECSTRANCTRELDPKLSESRHKYLSSLRNERSGRKRRLQSERRDHNRTCSKWLPEQWWDCAMGCFCYLRNLQDRMADGTAVFEKRLNENFDEPVIPFGTSVKYIPTSKKQVKDP